MAEKLSIIIPTLNEAENLTPLVGRIAAAVGERDYEIIIVDDSSPDATPQVCIALAQRYPLRLITRPEPRNGLSGAVLEGMAAASGEILLVMDADLQHPPERIGALLEPLEKGWADFVIGSRYAPGGTTQQSWTLFRRINSTVATLLARPFSGPVADPMSGFFALRRTTFQAAQRLTPLGYKIGLELMCKCRVQRVVEVPIEFGTRQHGQSKLSLREQFRYLEHLSRLYDFCYPRLSPMLKFAIVMVLACGVGFALFSVLLALGVPQPAAPIIAYAGAVFTTAVFHARYVRTQREFLLSRHPWREFVLTSLAEWTTCAVVAVYVVQRVREPWFAEAYLIGFAAAMVTRYTFRKELYQDVRGLRSLPRDDPMRG